MFTANKTKVRWDVGVRADQIEATLMLYEKYDLDTLNAERRVAMAKSLRVITVDELKKIGTTLFPMADDSWRELFYQFIGDHPHATYHHALTSDDVNIVYCKDGDKGLWFTAKGAKGPLGERGRTVMKQMIEGHK